MSEKANGWCYSVVVKDKIRNQNFGQMVAIWTVGRSGRIYPRVLGDETTENRGRILGCRIL